MMKRAMIASAVVLAFASEGALAACSAPASQVQDEALVTLLSGNTVCASRGGDRWQEEHHADSTLWDYKMGDGHAVDPRKQVGSWTATGVGVDTRVVYSYTGGGTYSYSVWDNGGGSYSFCDAGAVNLDFTTATTVTGASACSEPVPQL